MLGTWEENKIDLALQNSLLANRSPEFHNEKRKANQISAKVVKSSSGKVRADRWAEEKSNDYSNHLRNI